MKLFRYLQKAAISDSKNTDCLSLTLNVNTLSDLGLNSIET